MDVVSLIISTLGLLLSGVAAYQAKSARDAVKMVLEKENQKEDLSRVSGLILELEKARTIAMKWSPGLPQGRRRGEDLKILYSALDMLKTKAPIKPSEGLNTKLNKCASDLDSATRKISSEPPDDSGWVDARNALQLLHPQLEAAARQMKLQQL